MTSSLWIPCFDEWTQHVEFSLEGTEYPIPAGKKKIFSGDRHTVYETLQLMKSRIDAGLFHEVIITNDGSTDDTLDGIERFKRENNYRASVFKILNHWDNAGKMQRFFEAFEDCRTDIFVMTDGDMVCPGWETFDKLTRDYSHSDTMIRVHEIWEFSWSVYSYWTLTSWTRSLLREKVLRVFKKRGIWAFNLPGQGYGLEIALNHYLWQLGVVLTGMSEENIPKFLESFRKDRTIQWRDKDRTYERIMEIGCIK
jgi:glycosyltransferase involved in cell wall biosynthesis